MLVEEFRSRGARAESLGWLILIASVTASLVAYWCWAVIFRPSALPPSVDEGRPDRLAKQVQGRHLFGMGGGSVGSPSSVPEVAQMVLAGIISSGSARRGVAVILIDGKRAVTAGVGQEIMPDVILSRVSHDHVELTRRGQTINLRLPTKK